MARAVSELVPRSSWLTFSLSARRFRPYDMTVVALKVLLPGLAAFLGVERFLKEIQIAAGLTHPHILALHDSGEVGGFLYYVMPHLDGGSLRQRLDGRPLRVDDALAIVAPVAD